MSDKAREQIAALRDYEYGCSAQSADALADSMQSLLDENERLKAEIDEIHATGGTSYSRLVAAKKGIDSLRDENSRLTDAGEHLLQAGAKKDQLIWKHQARIELLEEVVPTLKAFVEDGFCNDRNCEQAIVHWLAKLEKNNDD